MLDQDVEYTGQQKHETARYAVMGWFEGVWTPRMTMQTIIRVWYKNLKRLKKKKVLKECLLLITSTEGMFLYRKYHMYGARTVLSHIL